MKRFICMILAMVLALGLMACGADPAPATPSDNLQHNPTPTTVQTEAPAEPAVPSAQIQETVVYEDSSFRLTAKEIDYSDSRDIRIKFLAENNSDINCTIHVEDVSVNGFMVYGNMATPAYAGTVSYGDIDFSESDLEENDIDVIEEVCFKLWAYDGENYNTLWQSEELTVSIP